ncbi:MAG: hypothetical protein ABSB35_32050 [Bryobacteraceae bacterium]|jgi:hypothetical protein
MKHALLLWLAIPLSAAVTDISVDALSAQAILRYTAPDSGRCTVAVSVAPSLTPVISDVDPTKFTNANSDSIFSFLDAGLSRTFVAGQKAAVRGIDNVVYSRALTNNTVYYYQITCGSSVSSILTFATKPARLGLSFVDPIQADPSNPGEMLNPTVDFSTRQFYTDPQTAVVFEPLTLPHDVSGCGPPCSAIALTSANVSKIGAGWGGSNFPYTITNDRTSTLVFAAEGLHFWGGYPYDNVSASYASDNMANLNWAQWVVSASSSGAGDVLTACLSVDKVSCHPWSQVITCNVPTSSGTCTFGTGATANQGGWIKPGNRFLNGPETTPRSGNATCNGTAVTLDQPVNHLWNSGTPILINGTQYLIAALSGDFNLTLQSSCGNGTFLYSISSLFWLFKMQAATADTVSINGVTGAWEFGLSPAWPVGGFWNEHSKQTVHGVGGQPGYLIQVQSGLGLYWFDATTGAASLIGAANLGSGNLCSSNSAAWDTRPNTTILYCANAGNAGISSFTYTPTTWAGLPNLDDNSPNQVCGVISPPCWTLTNLTAGTTMDTLATSFNPAYGTIGTAKGMSANFLIGINSLNHLIIRAWSTDSRPGWLVVFDPVATTNSRPGNAGCIGAALGNSNPGCVIAEVPTFAATGANDQSGRGEPLKGSVVEDAGPGIVVWGPYFWTNDSNDGGGPWQIGTTGGFAFTTAAGGTGGLTACPSNPYHTGLDCTAVPIDGQPYDPTPGPNETGVRGEYLTLQAGDYLGVGGDDVEFDGIEMVRVLIANVSSGTCGTIPSPCLWVQRGVVRDNLYCVPNGTYACGFGAPAKSSATNVLLQYTVSTSSIFWNYIGDPNGTSLVQEYDYDSRAHRATLNGMDIDASTAQVALHNNGCVDAGGQCYGMKIDPSGSTWNLLTRSTPTFDGVALQELPFNGLSVDIAGDCNPGDGCGNSTQIHPSAPGAFGLADRRRYTQDSRPFNGFYNGGQPCVATSVTGMLWKIAPTCAAGGSLLHRKTFPTKAAWGWHPLLDVSPTVIGATSSDRLKYCVVVNSGDCYATSLPGEIYFNVPWLTYAFSYFSGQASQAPDIGDITMVDASPNLDSVVQFPMDDPSDRGRRSRIVTRAFAPAKVNAPFFEVDAIPNNEWFILKTRSFTSSRAEVLLVKRPPEVPDSVDRTSFATPGIGIPAAPGSAMLEWGYLEYGSDGLTKFNCTSRTDNCRSSTNFTSAPFWYASETQTPTSCSSGCSIQPSLIPDRIAFWRWVRTDGSGNVTATGPTQVWATR